MAISRRAFLAGSGLAALAAGSATARRASWPRSATARAADGYRVVVPMLGRDGPMPAVTLSTASVYQGGAFMVTVANAVSGTIEALGRASALAAGDLLTGFFGVGTDDPPGPTAVTVALSDLLGQPMSVERAITVLRTQWTVDYIDLPPDVGGLLDPAIVLAEEARLTAIYAGVTARKWDGPWILPVDAPISGYFGEQRSFNGGPVSGHHGGTDFGAQAGDPVHATNSGTVVLAETLQVRGNMVIVDHGAGVFSGYGHQESLGVEAGQDVAKGDLLGHVGTTGLSTGAHLHWEMSVAGVLVDGLRWVDGSQGF